MTTREQVIAAAIEADSGFDGGDSADGTVGDSIVGIDAVERFYAIAFQAGAASRDAEIAQLNKEAQEKFSTLAKERDQPRAELAAALSEIERKMSAGQFVLEQLAAEQATNMRLREALEHFFPDWRSYTPLNWRYKAVEALSTTSDTSSLRAHDAAIWREAMQIAEDSRDKATMSKYSSVPECRAARDMAECLSKAYCHKADAIEKGGE